MASCSVCESRCAPAVGVDCTCGRHFHVGGDWLVGTEPLECPSCGLSITPFELKDDPQGGTRVEPFTPERRAAIYG